MPRIDLVSSDEAIRLGDEEGWFIIRRVTPEKTREFRAAHTIRIEAEGPGAAPREETDWGAVEQDQLDYVIQDWLVYGPDGTRAACTRANKLALPAAVRNTILEQAGAVDLRGTVSVELKNWSAPSGPPGQGATPKG